VTPVTGREDPAALLPAFFRFIGQWLPTGAAVSAPRNNVYFPGDQHGRPLLVRAGCLVLAAIVVGVTLSVQRLTPAADESDDRAASE